MHKPRKNKKIGVTLLALPKEKKKTKQIKVANKMTRLHSIIETEW